MSQRKTEHSHRFPAILGKGQRGEKDKSDGEHNIRQLEGGESLCQLADIERIEGADEIGGQQAEASADGITAACTAHRHQHDTEDRHHNTDPLPSRRAFAQKNGTQGRREDGADGRNHARKGGCGIFQTVIFQNKIKHRLKDAEQNGAPQVLTAQIQVQNTGEHQQIEQNKRDGEAGTKQNHGLGDLQCHFGKQVAEAEDGIGAGGRQHSLLCFSHR